MAEQRHPVGGEQVSIESPSAAAHARVVHIVHQALHAAEHAAKQFASDAPIRQAYVAEAKEWAAVVIQKFETGQITEGEAAFLASRFRNNALIEARKGLTPAGAALSKFLKEEGVPLTKLAEKYSGRLFGKAFKDLTEAERGKVCLEIAKKAGMTNPKVNFAAKVVPKLGKALVAVTIAIAIYQVAVAEDKVGEVVKQGATMLGFWAGAEVGAAAGAICGPGVPACSFIGGLAGGILGALLAESVAEDSYHWIKG